MSTGAATTILLTGVGLDGGPDIIRSLRADSGLAARIVGVDADDRQPGRHLCDAFHQVPRREDPGYVDSVVAIAESESARVVYPLPTLDQEPFARARERLESRGLAVPVSPEPAVRLCNDKWALYQHLLETWPEIVPETIRVESLEALVEAARSLGYPRRRVCIRRRSSRGAIGLRILEAGAARLDALLEENPGSPLVSLDEVVDTLGHAEPFPEYLVQEYLAPDEWDVDLLCRDGEPIVTSPRRNLSMFGAAASVAVLERSEELSALSREIASRLRLNAIVNIAFRHDRSGRPKLLEINPRIPFGVLASLGGGVNLVALAVRQAMGEPVEHAEPVPGGLFLSHYQSVVTDSAGTTVI